MLAALAEIPEPWTLAHLKRALNYVAPSAAVLRFVVIWNGDCVVVADVKPEPPSLPPAPPAS